MSRSTGRSRGRDSGSARRRQCDRTPVASLRRQFKAAIHKLRPQCSGHIRSRHARRGDSQKFESGCPWPVRQPVRVHEHLIDAGTGGRPSIDRPAADRERLRDRGAAHGAVHPYHRARIDLHGRDRGRAVSTCARVVRVGRKRVAPGPEMGRNQVKPRESELRPEGGRDVGAVLSVERSADEDGFRATRGERPDVHTVDARLPGCLRVQRPPAHGQRP